MGEHALMRLAVFTDQVFWFDGQEYSTDEAYTLFPVSFASKLDRVVFLGRLAPVSARKPYALTDPKIEFCPLPYYESVYDIWKSGPYVLKEIRRAIRNNASQWDAAWICGPNPVGQVIARECIKLGIPIFLVVRQNLVRQMKSIHPGLKGIAAVTMARYLEYRFKRLARGRIVFAVGEEISELYRPYAKLVHSHFPCLVDESQMSAFAQHAPNLESNRLLCVGRLSPEKGYDHLLEAMSLLKHRGVQCSLDFAGTGPTLDALASQAEQLGLETVVNFHGYVPYGPELFSLYQQATMLVVPSLSEGFPQVVAEALCAGLPVIASTVGGMPAFLTHLQTAVLVPPANPHRLAEAIEQLLTSPELKKSLGQNGRALMAQNTLEAQRDRMLTVIRSDTGANAQDGQYRSALDDYPGGQPPDLPSVSAIVPVYNEIAHIRSIVESLLSQDYPALNDIWFVDGKSDDGTFEELERLKEHASSIHVLTNPRRNQAAAFNLAFSQLDSDIVIRLDGHAQYADDIVRQSVKGLLETGAGGVGAIARPIASSTLVGQAIAAAHESRLGVGVAKFRQSAASGWVDTIWNGCYWKHVIDKTGPFREDSWRTEDNDFNARVRALGYGLYLSPEIRAYYYPRQSLTALWRQYHANGIDIVQMWFKNRQAIRLRHFVPLAFVSSLLFLAILSIVWWPARFMLLADLGLYALAVLSFSLIAWRKQPGKYVILLPLIFGVLHASYGIGSLYGLLQVLSYITKHGRHYEPAKP